MLVNLKEILAIAEERKCAVGAFNTPNLECLLAVIDAAQKLGTPVIISHAELHESISPLEKIGPVMVQAAEKASVPVCVQLDHGETLEYIERSLEIGFTGIMYDGSLLPYEDNLVNTKKAVAMARKFNAGVEAELGAMQCLPAREARRHQDPYIPILRRQWSFAERQGSMRLPPASALHTASTRQNPCLTWRECTPLRRRQGSPLSCTAGAVFQRKITAERSGQAFARSITTPICPMQEAGRSGNSSQRKT